MDRQQREHEERELAERISKTREKNERNYEIGYGEERDAQFMITQPVQFFDPERYKHNK
jgi:hypothetical protein